MVSIWNKNSLAAASAEPCGPDHVLFCSFVSQYLGFVRVCILEHYHNKLRDRDQRDTTTSQSEASVSPALANKRLHVIKPGCSRLFVKITILKYTHTKLLMFISRCACVLEYLAHGHHVIAIITPVSAPHEVKLSTLHHGTVPLVIRI